MYVTQKKRAVYDRSGALYKYSYSKKGRNDAPQSNLRSIEEQNQLPWQPEDATSKCKSFAEYALIAIMLLCCYLLFTRLATLQFASPYRNATSTQQQKNTSFAFFQSSKLFQPSHTGQLRTVFIERSQCSIVQGNIFRCDLAIQVSSNSKMP